MTSYWFLLHLLSLQFSLRAVAGFVSTRWMHSSAFTTTTPTRRSERIGRQEPQPEPLFHDDLIYDDLDVAAADAAEAEADDHDCPMPLQRKLILIISDSTGSMAKSALRKLLAQFDSCQKEDDSPLNDCELETRTFTFVRSEKSVENILHQQTQSRNSQSVMVIYTFADPSLRAAATRLCHGANFNYIDLLGGLFDEMGQFLQQTPAGLPNYQSKKRRTNLSPNYFRRVEAVEFTLQTDDGRAPWLLKEADVILVGVSRTGKTPLSVVLSHTMGLRVANVPLVLEVPPPAQLLDHQEIDARRVFCLTLAPNILGKIRANRLERRNVLKTERRAAEHNRDSSINSKSSSPRTSNYADRNYLLKDLVHARRLAQAHNWTEVDVTGRAVEETATYVVEMLTERFPTMTFNN